MNREVQKKLESFEVQIKQQPRYVPFESFWTNDFPDEGAVYVMWEKNVPVYVGETSGFKKRMSDLARPVNHAFTKKMQKRFGFEDKDIQFLRKTISQKFKVSFVKVDFGRSEIEEYLILLWRKKLINKPTKRLLNGSQYKGVVPE